MIDDGELTPPAPPLESAAQAVRQDCDDGRPRPTPDELRLCLDFPAVDELEPQAATNHPSLLANPAEWVVHHPNGALVPRWHPGSPWIPIRHGSGWREPVAWQAVFIDPTLRHHHDSRGVSFFDRVCELLIGVGRVASIGFYTFPRDRADTAFVYADPHTIWNTSRAWGTNPGGSAYVAARRGTRDILLGTTAKDWKAPQAPMTVYRSAGYGLGISRGWWPPQTTPGSGFADANLSKRVDWPRTHAELVAVGNVGGWAWPRETGRWQALAAQYAKGQPHDGWVWR